MMTISFISTLVSSLALLSRRTPRVVAIVPLVAGAYGAYIWLKTDEDEPEAPR